MSGMLPFERARAWWTKHRKNAVPFSELVSNYITCGHYLWSSPTEFILACELPFQPPGQTENQVTPNAWFIHLAATASGLPLDPQAFIRLAPRAHPWILFDRRGKFRVHRWNQFAGRQASLPMNHG